MKSFRIFKRIVLFSVFLLGLVLILFGQIPELISSKPVASGDFGPEVRKYIFENIFAIAFFVFSLVVGILIEIYGILIRRNITGLKEDGIAAIMLGIFILVSGIWVLTDSNAFSIFTTDYGGALNRNVIVFISYVSIMVLPVIFISFLQHIIRMGKRLWIINVLFILNLSVFVLLTGFKFSKNFYYVFIIIHHVLICILMAIGIVYCIRGLRHAKDKQEIWISRGVFLFALFSGAALIAFLLGSERIYVIIYSIGFIILIVYMIKATIHKMLSAYNQSVKTEFYKSLAFTDVLTEVKNRNAFIKEQNDSPVNENTCCVVMDMNRLKLVNDTFGHSAGDQLIRCSAKVIYDAFSDIGVCYRIGGDEFAVICRNTDESAVKGCIEKMNKLIVEFNSDADPKISLSCGYAFGGNGITDIMDLHDAADREMYLDKKAKHYVRE